jgi:prophage regulatory protein
MKRAAKSSSLVPPASETSLVRTERQLPERTPDQPDRLLRFPAVRERTGLSRTTIWRMERRGEFPRHHRIAPNVVAWKEADIARWIGLRTSASR